MFSTGTVSSIREALSTLASNPLRTALSTLGIVMGSASLVAVLALGDGLDHYVRREIERTTDFQAVVLSPVFSRTVDGQRFPRSDTVHLDVREARAIIEGIPGVAGASLGLMGGAELASGRPGAPRAALVSATWHQGKGGFDSRRWPGLFGGGAGRRGPRRAGDRYPREAPYPEWHSGRGPGRHPPGEWPSIRHHRRAPAPSAGRACRSRRALRGRRRLRFRQARVPERRLSSSVRRPSREPRRSRPPWTRDWMRATDPNRTG